MSLYHASSEFPPEQDDPFRSLGVKCVSVLGQMAISPAPMALNREIGVFLITIVAGLPDTPTADAVEALDLLFDIYGAETNAYDREVFLRDNFLQQFEDMLPKVKTAAKRIDRRKDEKLRTRVDEAALNLIRFVQYKSKNCP